MGIKVREIVRGRIIRVMGMGWGKIKRKVKWIFVRRVGELFEEIWLWVVGGRVV